MISFSKNALLLEMEEANEFFDGIVERIPEQDYRATRYGDDVEDQPLNQKFQKKPVEAPAHKQRNNKKQAMKQELEGNKKNSSSKSKRRKLNPSSTNDDESADDMDKQAADNQSGDNKEVPKGEGGAPFTSRIAALRARLKAKIEEKQTNRPKDGPDQISKRAARRADKKKREEEAKQKAKQRAGGTAVSATTAAAGYQIPTFQLVKTPAEDLAAVDFGKFSGLNPDGDKTTDTQTVLKNLTKTKNLHKMLADAEAKHEKLQELKRKGKKDEEAKAQLDQMQWKDAFKEADGTRVKDDPAKLKKQLKKKVAKKAKSTKAWQSRTDQMKKATDERLKIRQHNLNARKQGGKVGANLSRKEIRTTEDGRDKKDGEDKGRKLSRAGFEGRKRDFLNKKKAVDQ